MEQEQFYLSEPGALDRAVELTGLAQDEIETIVGGYFTNRSRWAGKLKGKLVVLKSGLVTLRKSFGGKLLWKGERA